MTKSESISAILDMVYSNGSITRKGCYDLGIQEFEKALEHLLKTGENKLDEHDKIIYAGWHNGKFWDGFDKDELEFLTDFMLGKLFWKPYEFSDGHLDAIKRNVELTLNLASKNKKRG